MKRILVPCDFSQAAQHAYTFALDIAKRADAQIFVLFALDLPWVYEASYAANPHYFDPTIPRAMQEDAEKKFQTLRASHSRQEDISFSVIQGAVSLVIRDFIQEHNIDLVVMGTHGTNTFFESLIGSNTEKVVRLSPAPVFAVRKAVNLSSIKNIVLPINLPMSEAKFMKEVKALQSFFKATIHLLEVNTPYNMKRTGDEKDRLDDFAKKHGLGSYSVNVRDDFSEQEAIMNFARDIHGDMIAMATHGRRGLSHLFLGSITEDVVNHVECPIWTYSIRK